MKTSIILLAVVSLVFVSGAPLDSSDADDAGAVQTNEDENTYKILPVEEPVSSAPVDAAAESESVASKSESVPEPAQDAPVVHVTQSAPAKTKKVKPERKVIETDSSEIEIIHHSHKNKEKKIKEKEVIKEVKHQKKQQKGTIDVPAQEEPVAEPAQAAPAQDQAKEPVAIPAQAVEPEAEPDQASPAQEPAAEQ